MKNHLQIEKCPQLSHPPPLWNNNPIQPTFHEGFLDDKNKKCPTIKKKHRESRKLRLIPLSICSYPLGYHWVSLDWHNIVQNKHEGRKVVCLGLTTSFSMDGDLTCNALTMIFWITKRMMIWSYQISTNEIRWVANVKPSILGIYILSNLTSLCARRNCLLFHELYPPL